MSEGGGWTKSIRAIRRNARAKAKRKARALRQPPDHCPGSRSGGCDDPAKSQSYRAGTAGAGQRGVGDRQMCPP